MIRVVLGMGKVGLMFFIDVSVYVFDVGLFMNNISLLVVFRCCVNRFMYNWLLMMVWKIWFVVNVLLFSIVCMGMNCLVVIIVCSVLLILGGNGGEFLFM